MKPLLYDLIKQDFMNLEKGKILCFDQIKAKVQTDKTITVTAALYFNSPNSFNINSVLSIEFGTFPDSSETKLIFNIEVGKPGSTTYYNIDIMNSGNKITVVDKIRSSYDYEYNGDSLESIEALNEFLNNTPILNGVTLKSSLLAGGNTLNITLVDCSEDTFNSILQTLKFKLSQINKAKITNQYVWVTPNTINPEIHDMLIYDMRINGTPDEDHFNYDLNLPYQSYVNKYATTTNYPFLNYKTGEYRRNNTLRPLTGGSLASDFMTSIIDITYLDNDGKAIMLSSDWLSYIREDDGRTYVNGSDFIEETVTFPCDWSNATNLPTEQEWNLSWLEIKTKLK